MNTKHLKTDLKTLSTISFILKQRRENENDDDLLEYYFERQDKILKQFGLPEKEEYTSILEFTDIISDEEINNLIMQLSKMAAEYLLSDARPDLQILEDAIKYKQEAHTVLPELNIEKHIYTYFVYDEILMKGKDSPAQVLLDLEMTKKGNYLNLLGIIALSATFGNEEALMLRQLKDVGFKYLDEYLEAVRLDDYIDKSEFNSAEEFWNELNGEFNSNNYTEKFSTLADYLLNQLVLNVGRHLYKIIELEIYYFNNAINHPDPYVHKDNQQLTTGNWYFNGFGLDITFGQNNSDNDTNKNVYGGILIRGIKRVGNQPKYISGPANVLKEIFSKMGDIITKNNGIYLSENNNNFDANTTKPNMIQSTRIGLSHNQNEDSNKVYLEKPYRFLTDLTPQHKFKDKEKVIIEQYKKSKIKREEIKTILGYLPKNIEQ